MKKIILLLFIISFGCEKSIDNLLEESIVLENEGKYINANKILDEIIQIDSTFLGAYLNRGANKSILKNYESAIEDYKLVLKFDSKNKLALFNIGNNLKRLNKFSESINYYDKIINDTSIIIYAKDNTNPFHVSLEDTYYERGLAYYSLERFEDALYDFKACVSDNNPEAYYMLGSTFYVFGKDIEACLAYKKGMYLGNIDSKKQFKKLCE